jgi:hypothetical protein
MGFIMNKTIRFQITTSKLQLLGIFALLFVFVIPVELGSETVSLTTYYPPAYGAFDVLRVPNYVNVQDELYIGYDAVDGTEVPHRITTTTKKMRFYSKSQNVMLAPGNGQIQIGTPGTTDAYFRTMCELTPYPENTGNLFFGKEKTKNLCQGVSDQHWAALAVIPSPNYVTDANGQKFGGGQMIHNPSGLALKSGYMLCCKMDLLEQPLD